MSYEINIKVAPVFTLERFNDPAWTRPGRWMYESLQFLPGQTTAKLLVNHDAKREIGVVHHLWRWDWVDGPWVVAHATLTDPPSWLRRGTRASFGFGVVQRRELNISGIQAEVIARGLCGKSASSHQKGTLPSRVPKCWDSGGSPSALSPQARCSPRHPMPSSSDPSARYSQSGDR